ncbi:MAG: hypothetical protein ACO1SX_25230 [Actinomycetota bacterium]
MSEMDPISTIRAALEPYVDVDRGSAENERAIQALQALEELEAAQAELPSAIAIRWLVESGLDFTVSHTGEAYQVTFRGQVSARGRGATLSDAVDAALESKP